MFTGNSPLNSSVGEEPVSRTYVSSKPVKHGRRERVYYIDKGSNPTRRLKGQKAKEPALRTGEERESYSRQRRKQKENKYEQ